MLALVLALILPQDSLSETARRLGSLDPYERADAKADLAALADIADDSLAGAIAKACAGKTDGRDKLLAALKDSGPLRTAAGVALASLADERDIKAIIDLFKDGDPAFTLPVAEAAGRAPRSAFMNAAAIRNMQIYTQQKPAILVERVALMLALGPSYSSGVASFASIDDKTVRRAVCLGVIQIADTAYGPQSFVALANGSAPDALSDAEFTLLARIGVRAIARYDSSVRGLFQMKSKLGRAMQDVFLEKASGDAMAASLLPDVLEHADADLAERVEKAMKAATGYTPKETARDERRKEWIRHFLAERRRILERKVPDAIDRGVTAVKSLQAADGSFPYSAGRDFGIHYALGTTSLCVYTLLCMEIPPDDLAVQKGIAWILRNLPFGTGTEALSRSTYEVSLLAVAMAKVVELVKSGETHDRCAGTLQRAADWLVAAQQLNGAWGYDKTGNAFDHSNTQFAVMGLRAAVNGGARVKKEAWEKALNHWKMGQIKDGGWDYMSHYGSRGTTSTNSMTAAGIMSIVMAIASLSDKKEGIDFKADPVVKKGLEALEKHASASIASPNYYWLYSLERACMAVGIERLGAIDWYADGAWFLVRAQQTDGFWQGSYGSCDTCFALLFLKRSHVAVETPSGKSPKPRKPGEPRERE